MPVVGLSDPPRRSNMARCELLRLDACFCCRVLPPLSAIPAPAPDGLTATGESDETN
jgi:hypothetical protein